MTQDTIRVGIIGAGANTRDRHIPGLQAIEGVEIVAVCNRSQESGERAAKQFGIERVCTNWQDIIQAPDVDAVVIGTWPYMHRLATVAALEADKHVMCEARMAMNASEAHCMYDALRSRPHLVAQIVPSPFSLRVDRTIQRLIRDGWLGDVLVVDVRAGGAFIDDRHYDALAAQYGLQRVERYDDGHLVRGDVALGWRGHQRCRQEQDLYADAQG